MHGRDRRRRRQRRRRGRRRARPRGREARRVRRGRRPLPAPGRPVPSTTTPAIRTSTGATPRAIGYTTDTSALPVRGDQEGEVRRAGAPRDDDVGPDTGVEPPSEATATGAKTDDRRRRARSPLPPPDPRSREKQVPERVDERRCEREQRGRRAASRRNVGLSLGRWPTRARSRSTSTARSRTTSPSLSRSTGALRRVRAAARRGRVLRAARGHRRGGDHRRLARRRGRPRFPPLIDERIDRYWPSCRRIDGDRRRCARRCASPPSVFRSRSSPARPARDRAGPRRSRPRGRRRVVVAEDDVRAGQAGPRWLPARARGARRRPTPPDVVAFEDTEAGVASAKRGRAAMSRRTRNTRPTSGSRRPTRSSTRSTSRSSGACRMTWVIAHRGASADERENTLPAFERAIELGADFVELDVQAAADGELVVCHDLASTV